MAAWGRGSKYAAARRGEGERILEGPRERRAEKGRGPFLGFIRFRADHIVA